MNSILSFGTDFIISFQSLGNWLVFPMKLFSFLGSEEFYLFFLPIIYWIFDPGFGLRLGTILLVSSGLNDILKITFQGPRPYWFSSKVHAYAAESSFGVPSGHAQISMSLWGTLARKINTKWGYFVSVLIIFFIGLSRLFLAVHFPHDVLLGWILGGITLWLFGNFSETVINWIKNRTIAIQTMVVFFVSMIILIPALLIFNNSSSWVMPDFWLQNAKLAGLLPLPEPVNIDSAVTSSALLLGMLFGAVLMKSRGRYSATGTLNQKLLRLLPGFTGLLILYIGLKVGFQTIIRTDNIYLLFFLRYIRYALVGFWVSAGAPWVFAKITLSSSTN